ncbi:PilT/PilU family type 4a pilus ATPase [Permianibacter aggregans]|uniref:Twitching motility protein PilU n=1 Tax=Permianibacter aggregans TaxID=1510150 RepID=A0A4R6UZC9_9GAMM|nr:PilT/PilU family type 4a pilus ATPase [Permianibacter aggregans]QGX41570.1 PilT/PilU family type 4a pilus ATPase [Permianibacter aggregans]TDQ51373.1 twitching motility protein PilU [Permianibacter aggregans]
MDIKLLLRLMAEKNASDLFFSTGAPPHMKIEGVSTPMGSGPLPPGAIKDIAYKLMDAQQIKDFEENWEANFALAADGVGRFRVNVFKQRGEVGIVMRHIKTNIPALETLKLPPIVKNLIMERVGLVLVCGPTGSGKSTSLASLLDYRNRRETGHILTIEDPIEFLHDHKMSIVDQREIGVDTKSFHNALKNAMREAPDVILIGEIRDSEAMEYALNYAQTGHLVLATIHGNNCRQVLDRIRNLFPQDMRGHVMKELSSVLKGIISQRLVRGIGGLRVPAVEIMMMAPDINEIIQRGYLEDLPKAIEKNYVDGMRTFDQSLFDLYKANLITKDDALHYAESKTDLSLRMRLGEAGGSKDASSQFSVPAEKTNPFKTEL